MAGLCWLVMVPAFFLSPPNILAAVNQDWLTDIVAAVKNKHVLHNIQPFIKSSEGNVLVIYSENSPISNDKGITLSISDITHNWSGYAFVFSNVADVPASDTSQLTQSFKHLEITKLGLNNIYRCYAPPDDAFQCTRCSSGGDVTPTCVANTALSSQEQGTDVETPKPGLDTGSGIPPGSGRGKEGQISKLRGGGRRKKGSKLRRGGRRKKGSKLRGGGRRRKGSKLRGGGRRRKGSKLRGGGRRRKGSKLRRGGRRRGKWGMAWLRSVVGAIDLKRLS
ncbi:uncharacterized protein LOC118455540 [Neolamprologus brichardi]|uniref:uncharacterized protein LOC118455540 n=1 Tax=Neolamprologus brichardi TaxID=32507 RepID=UPI0016438AC3|nr:uncharacterized protein LOC118455540 [Neolamprologus brichardi]